MKGTYHCWIKMLSIGNEDASLLAFGTVHGESGDVEKLSSCEPVLHA